ncbi:MAG: hypothetical protein ABI361_02925 [Nitrososphaera sp.]|jgi:hypothetical protein
MSANKTWNARKATLAAVIVAAVLGSIAAASLSTGQAFAQQQNANNTNNSTSTTGAATGGNAKPNVDAKIKRLMAMEDRAERNLRWRGLTEQSYSLVPGVKVLGVVEKSADTVSLTLAHVSASNTNGTETAIDNSPVTQNITLLSVASHSIKNPASHLDGSMVISSGWSGVQTFDLKLAGSHSLFDYHLIRTTVAEETGASSG